MKSRRKHRRENRNFLNHCEREIRAFLLNQLLEGGVFRGVSFEYGDTFHKKMIKAKMFDQVLTEQGWQYTLSEKAKRWLND